MCSHVLTLLIKSLVLGRKCKHQTNMSDFHPLEVVNRGSETQLQVAENLN